MPFLGIDLSLSNTGVVVVSGGKIVKSGNVKTKPPAKKSPMEETKRIIKIINSLEPYLSDDIELVCLEGLSFMARNTTALMQLAGLNYLLRERILRQTNNNYFLIENFGSETAEIDEALGTSRGFVVAAPTQLKKFICGNGRADKDVMMLETYKKYNVSLTDNNVCDAFGLALIAEAVWHECNKSPLDLAKYQSEVVSMIAGQLK